MLLENVKQKQEGVGADKWGHMNSAHSWRNRTATAEGRGCQERAKGKLGVSVSSGRPAHGTQMLRWTQARPGQFLGYSWALGESGLDGYLRIENI